MISSLEKVYLQVFKIEKHLFDDMETDFNEFHNRPIAKRSFELFTIKPTMNCIMIVTFYRTSIPEY